VTSGSRLNGTQPGGPRVRRGDHRRDGCLPFVLAWRDRVLRTDQTAQLDLLAELGSAA